jgi:hypothetical protein
LKHMGMGEQPNSNKKKEVVEKYGFERKSFN